MTTIRLRNAGQEEKVYEYEGLEELILKECYTLDTKSGKWCPLSRVGLRRMNPGGPVRNQPRLRR